MLECHGLRVSYSKKEILHGLDFSAKPSEITVILGKNGSGKTTLLRTVSASLPYSGSVRICGKEAAEMRPNERAKLVSVMPQMFKSPDVTVRDLVSFGRQPYTGISGILTDKDRNIVETVLEKTGLLPLADSRLTGISGGERQKAYFAMLLAQDTPIMLLDEPGAHLDMAYRKQLSAMLKTEKQAGKTVVAVLHDINRAVELADRLLVLDKGNLIFDGCPGEIFDSEIPQRIFGLKCYRCIDDNGEELLPVFR